jgi:hypothetical protein
MCFSQEPVNKDSIQICYYKGVDGIGGQDHCITIWFEDGLIFCKRICYSVVNNMYRHSDTELSRYKEAKKQAILQHYQESNNYLILDKRVEVSKSQFDKLIKLINEIKAHVAKDDNPNEIIISTSGGHYMIKNENETIVIIDWLGRYNRRGDIEKVLGLKSYLRCPCVEKDLKQINNNNQRR